MNVIDKIRLLREKRNLSQKEMGLFLGVSRETYRNLENGKIQLRLDDYLKICKILNVAPSYFLSDYDEGYQLISNEKMNQIKEIQRLFQIFDCESITYKPSRTFEDDFILKMADSTKKNKK